jgi:hypothetical protein
MLVLMRADGLGISQGNLPWRWAAVKNCPEKALGYAFRQTFSVSAQELVKRRIPMIWKLTRMIACVPPR